MNKVTYDDTFEEFYSTHYFKSILILLSKFTNIDHVSNVEEILHHIHVFGYMLEFHGTSSPMPKSTPLIWYTGAYYGLKKFKIDYINYINNEILLRMSLRSIESLVLAPP